MRICVLAILLLLIPSLALAADAPTSPAPLFDDNGTHLTVAQFVEKYIPADMPEGLGRAEVQSALEDAGANWVELAGIISFLSPAAPADLSNFEGMFEETGVELPSQEEANAIRDEEFQPLLWLITKAPHLDRLELTGELLSDSLMVAGEAANDRGYEKDSELWRRYVLNYRFDDEPISLWPYEFWTSIERQDINVISKQVATDFTVIERGYFGNLSDPVSLLQSRAGTKRELSILIAAALRSQGYATRFVRENRSGESWVEVYSGDPQQYDASAWTPVYPTAPEKTGDVSYATELCGGRITVITAGDAFSREQVTSRYAQLVRVTPAFKRDGTVDEEFTGYAISAWNDKTGGYVPLDDLEYPSSDKDYPLDEAEQASGPSTFLLAPGDYRLEWGVRYPGGLSHVGTHAFTLVAGGDATIIANIDPPADLPQTALVERGLGELSDSPRLMQRGRYVFLVGDGGEPSLRAADLLKP
ncbi:MAG: transglutaminase-like domain-containing protein, partial [bacterium]|nr:transglutaminase-like domain-containing protein [bacterium]